MYLKTSFKSKAILLSIALLFIFGILSKEVYSQQYYQKPVQKQQGRQDYKEYTYEQWQQKRQNPAEQVGDQYKSKSVYNAPSYNPNQHQNSRNQQFIKEQMQIIATVVYVVYFGMIIVWIILGMFVGYKCYLKRKAAKKVKQEMLQKQTRFASSMGMTVLQMRGDNRFGTTNHF